VKAFDIADLIRGVPELWEAEPFFVTTEGRTIGVLYPLRASRHLFPTVRRELWAAIVGPEDARRRADSISDDEIMRVLEEAGRE
jgi:hypothetical protein